MHNLSKSSKLIRVSNPVAAGTGNVVCSTVDRQGFTGVLIIAAMGAIVSGALASLKAQGGAVSNGSDAADLIGASRAIADTDDNKLVVLDLNRPGQRYITPVITRATQNATVDSVFVLLYNPSNAPVDLHSTVAGVTVVSEPDIS